jgi:starch phosphorylase
VECLLGSHAKNGFEASACYRLQPAGMEGGETVYEIRFVPGLTGLVGYKIRIYPYNNLLCHPFEMGYMKWL